MFIHKYETTIAVIFDRIKYIKIDDMFMLQAFYCVNFENYIQKQLHTLFQSWF